MTIIYSLLTRGNYSEKSTCYKKKKIVNVIEDKKALAAVLAFDGGGWLLLTQLPAPTLLRTSSTKNITKHDWYIYTGTMAQATPTSFHYQIIMSITLKGETNLLIFPCINRWRCDAPSCSRD